MKSFENPSLRIIRPVIDLPPDFQSRMIEQFPLYDVRKKGVRLGLGAESYVALVSAREVINMFRFVDRQPDEASVDELADYLNDELPPLFDEEIDVLLRPFDRIQSPKAGSGDNPTRYVEIFRSRSNVRLTKERQLAHLSICKFFYVAPESVPETDVWTSDRTRIIKIATCERTLAADRLSVLLKHSVVFPSQVKLGSVEIEDA